VIRNHPLQLLNPYFVRVDLVHQLADLAPQPQDLAILSRE